MSLDAIIAQAVARAVKELYGIDADASSVQISNTKKEFEGNLTVVVFPWVKAARKAPEAVGTEIGQWLVDNEPAVDSFNVIKGFLNIVIEPTFWTQVLRHIESTPDYGFKPVTDDSPLVMVEYSSPNTNKPLHLGHVRNNLLGYSLAEILKACGNRVVKTNIVNDRGIHICKSMLAWQKWGNGITPEQAGKKGDHLIGDFYVLFDKHYKSELDSLINSGMTKEEAEAASPLMQEARAMLRAWEEGDSEVRSLWAMMNPGSTTDSMPHTAAWVWTSTRSIMKATPTFRARSWCSADLKRVRCTAARMAPYGPTSPRRDSTISCCSARTAHLST